MKYFVLVCCALLHLAQSQVLPDYLKKYTCRRSDPEYQKCVLEGFENMRQYFSTGIPELGVPPMDPYVLPYMSINRTIKDVMSVTATGRNIRLIGLKNTIIDDLKADPINYSKEMRLTVPWLSVELDYDVRGQMMAIPMKNSGHFQGNFTNIQMYVKGSLKTYQNNGVEYFKVNKMNAKISIGGGEIKMTSDNKEMQYAADMITKFFNENPRRVLDTVSPMFMEWSKDFLRELADEMLAKLPASEWVSE